jgi:phosphotransferase system enzyme I (PtsI)
MKKLQGIAVSSGVAIGQALVLDYEGLSLPRRLVMSGQEAREVERLDQAVAATCREITRDRDTVSLELGEKYGAIFESHFQILQDTKLLGELRNLILQQRLSAESAVQEVMRRYAEVFEKIQSRNLGDIIDIERRMLKTLVGRRREDLSKLDAPVLVLAHNLTPSETANLDTNFVLGFVTEIGGPGSHTAIVAAALEIPAVVGIGSMLDQVASGDTVIIDGDKGLVIVQPDETTIARYRIEREQLRNQATRLEALSGKPAETQDGVRIELLANIEFPHEVEHCIARGADGIGLYRTEFLYLGHPVEPDEEAHFLAYTQVVQSMGAKPVTIRTFDLGADKTPSLPMPDREEERNPALGQRSIRLSLRYLPMFRTQLRAALRASVQGNVRLMFPLISTLHELRQAKMILADVMEDLDEAGIPFDRTLPVGMMVEVPAVVMMIDHFVDEVDFLSIGTNDLIQYTLAVDRSNKDVVWLYNAADPAVLKLIVRTIEAARRRSLPVNLCGQMSSSPIYTMLLVGMGLRQLSVPPSTLPEIKSICRNVTVTQCEHIARHALTLENARDVKSYLRGELKKWVPEIGF